MTQVARKTESWCAANFREFEKRLNGNADSSLPGLCREAFSRFTELQFPTLRNEAWKYTSVAPIARTAFKLSSGEKVPGVSPGELAPFLPADLPPPALVFVNGQFTPGLADPQSLPAGLTAASIDRLLRERNRTERESLVAHLARYAPHRNEAFVALNTAFLGDGAFVRIARGTVLEEPIHLVFVTTAGEEEIVSHPRVLVIAEEESQASVIESYVGPGENVYFTNPVTEVHVAASARLDHYKIQLESDKAFHVAAIHAVQERGSAFSSHSFTFGGRLVRNDIHPVLAGDGAETALNGLYMLGEGQHSDTQTVIDHAEPHCFSRELYKGILSGKSRGVFSGKIIVRKDAQKTNAVQHNGNLLLSADATIDSKPQLEIFADDVKCTHGATVGQIDRDALFYLQTRGIDRESARSMLIHAFAGELVDEVRNEPLRRHLEKILLAKLERIA